MIFLIKGVSESALLLVNDDYFMINDKGEATVGFEGSATIELSSGKVCEF